MIDQYLSKEELRRLLSALLVTVGAIVLFALFAFIVVPGLRNANKPAAAPTVTPPQLESGWLDPTEYPPARGYEVRATSKPALTANPEVLDRGKALFNKECVYCHGPSGHGDGPASKALHPSPRNFSKPDGWVNGYKLTEIYATLTTGVKGSAMAPYTHLPANDRIALAHYVQSLGPFAHGVDDQPALDTLAKQLAARPELVPNKIPVSMAIDRLADEFVAAPPLAVPAGGGLRLLANAVVDPARAAQVLAEAPRWRGGAQDLAAVVVPGVPDNGFAVSVATLTQHQWQALYLQLIRALRGRGYARRKAREERP